MARVASAALPHARAASNALEHTHRCEQGWNCDHGIKKGNAPSRREHPLIPPVGRLLPDPPEHAGHSPVVVPCVLSRLLCSRSRGLRSAPSPATHPTSPRIATPIAVSPRPARWSDRACAWGCHLRFKQGEGGIDLLPVIPLLVQPGEFRILHHARF
jgi:hypothetical protein